MRKIAILIPCLALLAGYMVFTSCEKSEEDKDTCTCTFRYAGTNELETRKVSLSEINAELKEKGSSVVITFCMQLDYKDETGTMLCL